ncbi:MAG: ribonuclease J [Lachnospiraceae bacterium]|nr:ribonuclease J [Lachnospiraceae bacterium]MBP5276389.1 ribonuclease J [Lachnospiraceae bacterium]MBP5565423.1 ribonuclease J [Lachnospiraceae bacterium]MCR4696343.1 ribonuclease J [Lachnospiraceae bacterium]
MKKNNDSVRIIPLGGLERIGVNITAIEYNDQIIVVDCGLGFPEDDMFGIDLVIPDVTYLEEHKENVLGFVITHGHEDHIGALPYILKKINVPVFATTLTQGLIENKLIEHKLNDVVKRYTVHFGDTVRIGSFGVEFIKTNHSIVDAAALAIHTPAGVIIHTGDFKVDYTPVYGDSIDLVRFAELGNHGVLALMCDSTNAEREGFTPSEKTVGHTFDNIFNDHQDSRIIVATFASNVDRVQQILNSAKRYNRKVVVEGRSMVNIIDVAKKLERITIPENTLIDIENIKDYPDNQTVLITTGSQGESMAALSRMAMGTHRKVKISPNDVVIFSSHPIPGNEKAVTKVINDLLRLGADVIFEDTHVSGHACREEIKLIYSLTKPQYAIPVHGEYKHLKAHAKLATELGMDKENIFILSSGNVLQLNKEKAEIIGNVEAGSVFVDGLGVGDVGNIVLRDRQKLAEDGIVVVVIALDSYSGELYAGPEIVTRGFVYEKESEELLGNAQAQLRDYLEEKNSKDITDIHRCKNIIRDFLSDYFWKNTKRKPMILPIITEV